MKINRISPDKHRYLQIVSNIANPPKSLYFIGNLPPERLPTIAIVGTRKPSSYGKEVTHRLATDLAKKGIVVVSGLALGVDALAHKAAVEAGGTTLAVLPNGLPRIYPATNRNLAGEIIKSDGALISEYESDVDPARWTFLERNRLVAGIADAVLITEAAAQSGTLNTAMHALEQGKEVFVVPGNITSPLSAGCNKLLRQGATPVTCAEDIIEAVAPDLLDDQSVLPLGNNQLETDIIRLISDGERDGETIQRTLGADPAEFSTALTMLELAGSIKSLGANQWTLR